MSQLDQIPEKLHAHIKEISKSVKTNDAEDPVEVLAGGWLEKEKAFTEKIQSLNMTEVEQLDKDDPRGAVAITRSGSLIQLGPKELARHVEYTSIGLRTNVPPSAEKEGAVLGDDVQVDQPIQFEVGPVKSTSDIYKIAVCPEKMDVDEQKETLANATRILEEEFTNINETMELG